MNKKILFYEKPIEIFILLVKAKQMEREMIISDLSLDLRITYSHVIELVKKYEKYGLISKEKKDRRMIITLTKKGIEIAEEMEKIVRKLEG